MLVAISPHCSHHQLPLQHTNINTNNVIISGMGMLTHMSASFILPTHILHLRCIRITWCFHPLLPSMHYMSFVGVADDDERMEKQSPIGG